MSRHELTTNRVDHRFNGIVYTGVKMMLTALNTAGIERFPVLVYNCMQNLNMGRAYLNFLHENNGTHMIPNICDDKYP